MRKLLLNSLWKIFILGMALFCWYHALILSGDMVKMADRVSLRYQFGGVSYSAVEQMIENESVPFAAWKQINNITVEEPEFSRESNVNVIEVAGDAELVLPVDELASGFFPVRDSMDTCAVDTATAYTLWGGVDVVGEALTYDGTEYIVTGVFSHPENTLIVYAEINPDDVFPYLDIAAAGTNTSRRQADEFLLQYSLPEPDILIDRVEAAAILRQFALFPALLAATILLRQILLRIFGKPVSFLERACFVAAMGAGIVLTAWAVGFSPVFPAAAIPSRWSDFSFWVKLVEGSGERIIMSRAFSWPFPDILWWYKQWLLLIYAGVSIAGYLISLSRRL